MLTRRELLKIVSAAGGLACLSPGSLLGDDNPYDIRDVLEKIRKSRKLPALAAVIVKDGEVRVAQAVGVRKQGDPTPVTDGDQFHLGSCTKALTATLAAVLVEAGKIRWESTIADVLGKSIPEIHEQFKGVTLQQLCCHRAGMSGDSNPASASLNALYHAKPFEGTPRMQRLDYLKLILKEKPTDPPGSKFVYSNRNYAVAGAMLETALDKSWEELLQEHLFKPLKITTAGFGAMGAAGKIDQPWQHRVTLLLTVPLEPGPHADNPPAIGPAGTVHLSAADWGKFLLAHVEGESGKHSLLPEKAWKHLHRSPYEGDYAFGWIAVKRDWAGGPALTHAGSNTQNFAVAWLAPGKRFAVGVMTNIGGAQKAVDEVATVAIQRFAVK